MELILAFVFYRIIRQELRRHHLAEKWNAVLIGGFVLIAVLSFIGWRFDNIKPLCVLLCDAVLLGAFWVVLKRPDFKPVRPIIIAAAPLLIVSLLSQPIHLFARDFYNNNDDFFDAAIIFAFIWMIGFWTFTKKQRKALEQERIRAQQREKEFQLSESMKAELEVQVKQRTADLTTQKEALQQALTELKSTQTQLIQSEKMASLGELTAGIAHEIQNPLNFVNNFSDLNTELIGEMQQALEKGDLEEAKAIANDIVANEQKINHHGKRADAIVKGMLQHSRNSTGQKEPVDVNALADEYLRLAYHGLRAKDKSFNASLKTEFDPSMGKIELVAQDIGRVILNLITNAFYTVNEKKKQLAAAGNASGYEPTVTVTTRRGLTDIFITVTDNGNGVPDEVADKIFQPFFTTKPTGEGTGLGLSMSYDIITKAHEGELKLRTTPGEGSSFIIRIPIKHH